jgi:hypothetical protein
MGHWAWSTGHGAWKGRPTFRPVPPLAQGSGHGAWHCNVRFRLFSGRQGDEPARRNSVQAGGNGDKERFPSFPLSPCLFLSGRTLTKIASQNAPRPYLALGTRSPSFLRITLRSADLFVGEAWRFRPSSQIVPSCSVHTIFPLIQYSIISENFNINTKYKLLAY